MDRIYERGERGERVCIAEIFTDGDVEVFYVDCYSSKVCEEFCVIVVGEIPDD